MRRGATKRPFVVQAGLTFGEMLVVLSVFIILAIIFTLSSTQAMVKARYSRALQETKMLKEALSAYEGDSNALPGVAPGLRALTGSIRYVSRLPIDPFSEGTRQRGWYTYLSHLSSHHRAIIVSVGPDGDSDLLTALQNDAGIGPGLTSRSLDPNAPIMATDAADKLVLQFSYDPTNGTISSGDVITVYE